jgi:hypothetical protein
VEDAAARPRARHEATPPSSSRRERRFTTLHTVCGSRPSFEGVVNGIFPSLLGCTHRTASDIARALSNAAQPMNQSEFVQKPEQKK